MRNKIIQLVPVWIWFWVTAHVTSSYQLYIWILFNEGIVDLSEEWETFLETWEEFCLSLAQCIPSGWIRLIPRESSHKCCGVCFRVFNKVKSRSAHMKSHRPPDADSKRPRVDRERSDKLSALDDKHRASPTDNHSKPSAVTGQTCSNPPPACP